MCVRRGACIVHATSVAAALYGASTIFGVDEVIVDSKSPRPANVEPERLVVHEWGTFTSLQDEEGRAIGGVNADDEPVPDFVHRISRFLLLGPRANTTIFVQGAPRCHPDVTMRLETPVVYFYPPTDARLPLAVDIEVAFRGGWLSEYYPAADVVAPGVKGQMSFGALTKDTVGRLQWNGLRVGTSNAGPETSSKVWLTPRAVASANITSAEGENERFLFYRGVGHVESPLRVSQNESGESLILTADFPPVEQSRKKRFIVPRLWLVDVGRDKSCAYRRLEGFDVPNDGRARVVAITAANFGESQFSRTNIDKLCIEMRTALIDDGLSADEADALLKTWRLSYFETPGLRLFYLLPRAWTDEVLPMKLSMDAELVRTMVGRIEIVTPAQRELLRKIAGVPERASPQEFEPAGAFRQTAEFRAYDQLGRFRNALLLDELQQRATPELRAFVDRYGLHGYKPAGREPAPAIIGN